MQGALVSGGAVVHDSEYGVLVGHHCVDEAIEGAMPDVAAHRPNLSSCHGTTIREA